MSQKGAESVMGKALRDNSLTLVLVALFAASLLGHWIFGWRAALEDLHSHGRPAIGLWRYASDPQFLSTVFENWESEFLQMSAYVVLTAFLVQRGSAESHDPDEPTRDGPPSRDPQASWRARLSGPAGWLHNHALGLVLALLFVASFLLHWVFSARAAAQEAAEHGRDAPSLLAYLGDAQLWFESFQNWQSEFLSTAVLVVLSIFLRQKNSPESKAVTASNAETGA
jgi:hypothetical protein